MDEGLGLRRGPEEPVLGLELEVVRRVGMAARVEAVVVMSIRGTAGAKIVLRSYTSGGNTVLTPGSMYVVATFADKRFAPAIDLLGYAATSQASLEESVRLHKAMIENAPK